MRMSCYLLWKSGQRCLNINLQKQCTRLVSTIKQSPSEYCLNLVKKHDYEGFLCNLLLKNEIRSAAFAIRAFNVEIATVEDHVQDKRNGLMRLKFWDDTINNIYNDLPPKTPTALELHRILKQHKLSKHYFKRLIDARYGKLENSRFNDLSAIEKYAENAFSSIIYLLLEANGTKDLNCDHFASHLGKACGIITLIRAIPYYLQKNIIMLPMDLIEKNKVSAKSLFRCESSQELKETLFQVSSCANSHLQKAQSLKNKLPKEIYPIFLPYLIAEDYLEKLRQHDFNIFDPKLQRKENLLPAKLYWRKMLNRLF